MSKGQQQCGVQVCSNGRQQGESFLLDFGDAGAGRMPFIDSELSLMRMRNAEPRLALLLYERRAIAAQSP